MTFLTETPVWETGVYQLEVLDPVQGGTAGVSNTQGKQLANRTSYLKQAVDALATSLSGVAPLDSPNFTGDPKAPTAPANDNDTSLATTAFVQRALQGVTAVNTTGGTTNLTAVQAALAVITIAGALTSNAIVTVPTSAARIWRVSNNTTGSFSVTFKTATGAGILVPQGASMLAYGDGSVVVDALTAVSALIA